jgi:hypothetical protein
MRDKPFKILHSGVAHGCGGILNREITRRVAKGGSGGFIRASKSPQENSHSTRADTLSVPLNRARCGTKVYRDSVGRTRTERSLILVLPNGRFSDGGRDHGSGCERGCRAFKTFCKNPL